jgi:uracil-DNA glycosylase
VQAGFDWDGPALAPRLMTADPSNWPVQAGWAGLVRDFWASSQGRGLQGFLADRLAQGSVIYPPRPLRALELTAPEAVRVVILGQDPYHGPGQAEGLAFSVAPGVRIPPSLRNMFQELQRDIAVPAPPDGSLARWADQGVLLLNTGLTVEDGQPASHAGRGWEALTDAVIQHCGHGGGPKVFLIWGAHAQKKTPLIDGRRHLVLSANHPSPLSARRGPVPFVGCGHFGQANAWLTAQGRSPIAW